MKWAYYLHTNGDIIGKNPISYHDIEGPFVVCKWIVDTEKREDAWRLVLQALARGCRIERAKELSKNWNLTYEDSKNMLVALRHEITPELKKGLGVFAKEILDMDLEDYFTKVSYEMKRNSEPKG